MLTDEISRRDGAAADLRARNAGLDLTMRIEAWDKTAKVTFDKRVLRAREPALPPGGLIARAYRHHSLYSNDRLEPLKLELREYLRKIVNQKRRPVLPAKR